MSTKRRPSDRTGHTGCRRGVPSLRTVARKASPTLNWNSNERPVSARSGSAAAKSFQVTMESRRAAVGSLYDLVCPHEHRPRDREADRLRGPEIDDELELRGLLAGEVGRPR